MALIKPGRMGKRSIRPNRAYIADSWRGQLRVRSWPPPRGPSRYPWQAASSRRLAVSNKLNKAIHPRVITTMTEGLNHFLRANTGLRGTAAVRLRDWLYAIGTGREYVVTMSDGTIMWPAAVVKDCSDFLDLLCPRVGGLLVRTDTAWSSTTQCGPGRIMQMLPASGTDNTCPPPSLPDRTQAAGGY